MRSRRRRLPVLALLLCTPLFVSVSAHVGAEQADDALAQGGVCEGNASQAAVVQVKLDRAADRAGTLAPVRDVVVLNGQGYNYAAGPAREMERVQREQLERESGR